MQDRPVLWSFLYIPVFRVRAKAQADAKSQHGEQKATGSLCSRPAAAASLPVALVSGSGA
jgi:hypothetical protein